jgi:hypothetical protein
VNVATTLDTNDIAAARMPSVDAVQRAARTLVHRWRDAAVSPEEFTAALRSAIDKFAGDHPGRAALFAGEVRREVRWLDRCAKAASEVARQMNAPGAAAWIRGGGLDPAPPCWWRLTPRLTAHHVAPTRGTPRARASRPQARRRVRSTPSRGPDDADGGEHHGDLAGTGVAR